ncbi:unnamed protein product [Owenia fusiformis]|uniref:Uncharacterized protein n=1 Tax=Owenia fusiformis TaxID=6347 RepID=A0A8J1TQP1_OWEFU|nr:unnamed protein product [Owenia fusiformis]
MSEDYNNKVLKFLFRYIMGDLPALTDWLKTKPWVLAVPSWILRAIGAPIFLNNPISGLLILIGMFIANPWVAICGITGLISAIATAFLLGQDHGAISNGGCTFHGMLVGIVVSASIDKPDWYPWTVFPVVFLAMLSVYVNSGLGGIFSSWNIPAFNLPFCLVAFVFLAALPPNNPNFPPRIKAAPNETFAQASIDWGQIFLAIPCSCAQIYGSNQAIVGVLILLGLLIGSPILFLHAILGPFMSVFTALCVAAPPEQIYTGEWSYNAMLAATSLGGFFWVLSIQTHILALSAAIFSTIVYGAMFNTFSNNNIGGLVLAFPFVLTASIFLAFTSESKAIKRVPLDRISYPEMHWKLFNNKQTITPDGSGTLTQ